eukprot:SAG31_NODE_17393_length_672_cov_1.165794_2_plen_66_part_00
MSAWQTSLRKQLRHYVATALARVQPDSRAAAPSDHSYADEFGLDFVLFLNFYAVPTADTLGAPSV